MDKLLGLILANTIAMSSAYVKDTVLPPVQTSVNVNINIAEGYKFSSAEKADFILSDGENSYERSIPIAGYQKDLGVSFYISDGYIPGKEFTLTALCGVESIIYNGKEYKENEQIPIKTSYTENKDGEVSVVNSVEMSYIPEVSEEVLFYHNDNLITLPSEGYITDGTVMLPASSVAQSLSAEFFFDEGYGCYILRNEYVSVSLYPNNATVIGNEVLSSLAPVSVNGILYVPLNPIAKAFEGTLDVTQDDMGHKVSLKYRPQTPEERYINQSGHASDTEYMIWVSKANFRVHIFKGSAGNWEIVRSLRCSIGKPHTPTCEGTYKYYEPVAKWDYGSYYVAPVMRFNGGYALHSTLVRTNGTPYDNTLEDMVSHGCVRIDPVDMQWLFDTIPLYTTVHVTPY